jgi:AAA ATPase domain
VNLGARISRRDRAAFVGREREVEQIAELFVDDPPASVVLVHGPGGIGKSTLLREVARRGREAGWSPVLVEGRELPPLVDAIEEALAPASKFERPLVMIDTYERMAALGGHLRRDLLPALPEHAIVVIAGRRAPEAGWFEGGWETVVREIQLGPLEAGEARQLLESHGLTDARRVGRLANWAGGSPLALTLAAAGAADDPDWAPRQGGEVMRTLVRRLAESEIEGGHRDVLAVAAIARVTTADLLADVLPDVDGAAAMGWLEERTFAEPLGGGLTLHELVRRALRSDLQQSAPEREQELRLRIADSLYERAIAGRPTLTVDLAELVERPELRAFYSWEGSVRNRIDSVREGDAQQVALLLGGQGISDWWPDTRKLFEEAPELVAIARDSGDALCGFAISTTPGTAPPAAHADPVLGPVLRHAREHIPDGNVVIWRDAIDFTRGAESRMQAMINMSGILRSGLDNPRYAYIPVDPELKGLRAFLNVLGARHVEELDAPKADKVQEFHLIDYGEGGLLGAQRDMVYLERGVAPPRAASPNGQVDAETVRDALRNLQLPHALAKSPLASGAGVEERAESVRRLLEDACKRAFGESDGERLMQRVLVRGYLDPAPSHEQAADELNLSRAAYFRRLKQASTRLAEYLAGSTTS